MMLSCLLCYCYFFFFFNDTATTEIYTYWHTLSLHDALPIYTFDGKFWGAVLWMAIAVSVIAMLLWLYLLRDNPRSEEHTSELQSLMRISYAVFCLKKKKKMTNQHIQYN